MVQSETEGGVSADTPLFLGEVALLHSDGRRYFVVGEWAYEVVAGELSDEVVAGRGIVLRLTGSKLPFESRRGSYSDPDYLYLGGPTSRCSSATRRYGLRSARLREKLCEEGEPVRDAASGRYTVLATASGTCSRRQPPALHDASIRCHPHSEQYLGEFLTSSSPSSSVLLFQSPMVYSRVS